MRKFVRNGARTSPWKKATGSLVGCLLLAATALPLAAAPNSHSDSSKGAATTQASADSSKSDRLKLLSPATQQVYAETPDVVKHILCSKIEGETPILHGVVKVNHKAAFIRGRAFGKNVFDFMREHIDDLVVEGKLKAEYAPYLHRFFEAARTLTPDQRAVLADILNHEVQP